MKTETNYALKEAKAQLDSIESMVAALNVDYNANGCKTLEDAERRIQEDPLCIEVRSGWATVGDALNVDEFMILLCTGGPAVRIIGELDEHCAPTKAQIQYQDWGTPWTDYINHDPDKYSALIQYCQQFYYGK